MHEHKMGQVESHNVIKATQSATYIVKLKGFSLTSGISPQTYQVHPRLIQHLNSLNPNRSQASQFFLSLQMLLLQHLSNTLRHMVLINVRVEQHVIYRLQGR